MSLFRRLAIVVPALMLAGFAVVLAQSAISGNDRLPDQARTLVNTPKNADLVASAPDSMSAVTVSRDWREVLVSPKKK